METFAPVSALIGGVFIGTSAAVLLVLNGRIVGISGILGGMLHADRGEIGWRATFLVGLLATVPLPRVRRHVAARRPRCADLASDHRWAGRRLRYPCSSPRWDPAWPCSGSRRPTIPRPPSGANPWQRRMMPDLLAGALAAGCRGTVTRIKPSSHRTRCREPLLRRAAMEYTAFTNGSAADCHRQAGG